ncbi:3-hydroxyacyl-CoA dehydrogenase NAD-binding domain-containing protein [Chitinophaga sp. MM2321]|uniref:3-hydroxyacyl-CoA dehydrogenase NAD-binding domain-containing protein n=1 Tax=Chitinophaga sp. MM2321 TaxID=3137178 RepID=UPI0032D567F3
MELNGIKKEPVLIVGEGKLVYSVVVCLLQSGYAVVLCTENKHKAAENIAIHYADLTQHTAQVINRKLLDITDVLDSELPYKMAIVITEEAVLKKKLLIEQLENKLPAHAVIAINTESIPLSTLQEGCHYPERIIGLNWSEPAHTTYFLEIIATGKNKMALVDQLADTAKTSWGKDPYIVSGGLGIRAKMIAAMTREAFFLVSNGYASIEDIDRACRNDPGYYLPFAGNFRYIDLMGGACSYGRVMKDLNPELSKDSTIPEFFIESIEKLKRPAEKNKGLYQYQESDSKKLAETFRRFSYQIQRIMEKYPFNYKRENAVSSTTINRSINE